MKKVQQNGYTEDYSDTPSFYNSNEYFQKYLGRTSYYTALQNALTSCIARINPTQVIELGCALGTTTFAMSDIFTDIDFTGLDIRDGVIDEANKQQKTRDFLGKDNVTFIQDDMINFVATDKIQDYSFIFMLYSFHHIPDPHDNKINFIKNLYDHIASGSYVWIGETFLPENDLSIEELWKLRATEGGASTFWASVNDPTITVKQAREISQISHTEELKAGQCVTERNNEYLVTRSWAVEELQKTGFRILINEPVNTIGDGVILARK